MYKDELKKMLKEYLDIEINHETSHDTDKINVIITFDNEEICWDSFTISK